MNPLTTFVILGILVNMPPYYSMQLKEYPVEACRLHLLLLDLSNNSLSGLPSEIGKVSRYYLRVFEILTNYSKFIFI